jgi:hypothetical protein
MNASNVIYIHNTELQRRYNKVSEDCFGFGWEIEEAKHRIVDEALELAPFMNSREISKFISDLCHQMAVAAERGKR